MSQFRTVIKRLQRGFTDPGVGYLIAQNWAKMLRGGRIWPLIGSISETILTPDSNPYFAKLRARSEDGLVVVDVLGFSMYLDVDDPGLSRTLLQFGVREEISTKVFRDELAQLKREIEGDVTVLEIGANIGYFTLLEASVLDERGEVYAIEPVPENLEILERNIELNDVAGEVSTHQLAIGDRNGRTQLHMSAESNWHSPHRISDHSSSMTVEMQTADTFLRDSGVSPDAVNVIRTDTEGFEVEIFQGMEQILSSSTPLVVFVELHPSLRDGREINRVVEQLEAHDFRIVSTTLDVYGGRFDRGWHEKPVRFESFDELKRHHEDSDAAVLLIAKRDAPSGTEVKAGR